MNNAIRLEVLEKKDLGLIKDIYNYYIANSTATFHPGSVSEADLKENDVIFQKDDIIIKPISGAIANSLLTLL